MKKTWLIFRNEYLRHVKKKSFIFGILSMPFFVFFTVGVGILSMWLEYNKAPVGYVDPTNLFADAQQIPQEANRLFAAVPVYRFENEAGAIEALEKKEIQSYFILSDDYMSTGEVKQIKNADTGSNAEDDFSEFLRFNLVRDKPPKIAERLSDGTNLIIRSLDGKREMGENDWMVIMMPMFASIFFIIAVNISGSYLLQAVVEEKENRTMEIVVTSVSPTELMTGKVAGNLLVGLTQLVIWILFAVIGLVLIPRFFPVGQMPQIDLINLLLISAIFLPAFVMVSAAMGAVGATATEAREAQQIAGWFTIPLTIPFWFINAIMLNPNGAVSTAMSLFPITAPIALPMRAVFTTVPVWQIVLSVTLAWVLAIFMLWLSGRVFRLGMLRYGKRIRLREAFVKDVR